MGLIVLAKRAGDSIWRMGAWQPGLVLAMACLAVSVNLGAPASLPTAGAQELTVDDDLEVDPDLERPLPPVASDSSSAESSEPGARSLLDSITGSSIYGLIVVLLIFLLSISAVGLIVEHAFSIRRGKLIPEDVLADLEQMIALGQFDQAIEYCSEPDNDSLAADVVLAGLQRYRSSEFGFAEYKSAVEEAGEDYTGRLYRKTDVLGVIGAIAPMLGLTGTVLGMIEAFNTIAAKGGMARPDELAGGIGTALVTTLLGLVVAIPSMVAFAYFRNRIDSLVSEAGKRVEHVLMPLSRKR